MGTRENKIETYLKDQVKLIGGITRKWVSPGRDGVPDQIVIHDSDVFFVEVKTSDNELSIAQIREHKRLRDKGATVCTVHGHYGIDLLAIDLCRYVPLKKVYGVK